MALAQVSGAPRGGMLEAGPWHGMTWHGCLTWPGCAMPYNAMPCHGVLCMPCGSHVTCVVWIAVCHATLPCRDAFPMLACGGRRHASPRPAMPFHAPLCYHCPSYVPAMTNHAMPVMPCQAAPCRFIAASYAPLEPQMLNSLGKCVVWLIILADLIVGRCASLLCVEQPPLPFGFAEGCTAVGCLGSWAAGTGHGLTEQHAWRCTWPALHVSSCLPSCKPLLQSFFGRRPASGAAESSRPPRSG